MHSYSQVCTYDLCVHVDYRTCIYVHVRNICMYQLPSLSLGDIEIIHYDYCSKRHCDYCYNYYYCTSSDDIQPSTLLSNQSPSGLIL